MMMRTGKLGALIGLLVAALIGAGLMYGLAVSGEREKPGAGAEAGGVVNVYSSRHYGLEKVFEEFTREAGIQVRFTSGPDAALRERIQAEGRHTPADVYIAVDAGNLWLAAEAGLLQPIQSPVLDANIPAPLRDPGRRWFGLTKRVRTIMYHPERANPADLARHEDLAHPRWRDRLVLRPATHSYTQSLVAGLIAVHGETRAEEIVRGWVANRPQFIDSDMRILETLAAGAGDVALANHYYLGRHLEDNPDFPVRILWAGQGAGEPGAHVNISGAGLTAHARNQANALRFLEWLSGPRGQEIFSASNHEFPVNPNAPVHPIIAGFGAFRADELELGELGRRQADAIRLLDRAGYR